MQFKVIIHDSDLDDYIAGFESSLGATAKLSLPLTKSYLKDAYVVGLFNANNQMVGGFTLSTSSSPRLLRFVPSEKQNQIRLPSHYSWSDACEVVCVWKKAEVDSVYMALFFWPKVIISFLKLNKKFLLGHNQSTKLDKFYTTVGPETIYFGQSEFGLPSRLFIYRRSNALKVLLGLYLYVLPKRTVHKANLKGSNLRKSVGQLKQKVYETIK